MGKTTNTVKGYTNAVYHAIDLSLEGFLSQVKSSALAAYSGYLNEKIANLIIDIEKNNIREEELINFIEKLTETEKDLLYVVIKKSLDSKDRIVMYILAKLLSQQIKNSRLNYFEETLLANIDKFIESDFQTYITLIDNLAKHDGKAILLSKDEEEISLIKFLSIGILLEDRTVLFTKNQSYSLSKTDYSDELYEIVNKYFEQQDK